MKRFAGLVLVLIVLAACAPVLPTPTATKPPAPTLPPPTPASVPTATRAPQPTNTIAPTTVPTRAPTALPTATRTVLPTVTRTFTPTPIQYTYAVNEEQFNAIANDALTPDIVMYADNARVQLQDGRIVITADYFPINIKPSIANIVMTANTSNCALKLSVVGATFGYSSLTEPQKSWLRQAIERLLLQKIGQQRAFTCIDAVTIGSGVMTIKYR